MRYLTLIPILFALLIVAPLAAQDTSANDGWPVEQRCVGDPTPPPADWIYDGTIFVQGQQGIRAINDYYKTPYFALFDSPFIYGASLSPDGKWYAVPIGYQGYATMSSNSYNIRGIEVVRTNTGRKSYFVPLRADYQGGFGGNSVPTVQWTDNTHIMYEGVHDDNFWTYIIEPFVGEYKRWDGKSSPLYGYPAPNGIFGVVQTYIDDQIGWHLVTYFSGEVVASVPPPLHPVIWSPDSSRFVTAWTDGDTDKFQVALFDDAGNMKSVIISMKRDHVPELLSFSGDGVFLAFLVDNERLFIADTKNQKVIDTCVDLTRRGYLMISGVGWSPNGHQLAFRYTDGIDVLDLETRTFYTVSDVPGEVVAWGAAD